MKKLGLVLICMLLTASLFAMDITFGAAAGVNTSFQTGSDWTDQFENSDINNSYLRFGFEIGAFVNFAINKLFSIQPEFNYIMMRFGSHGKEEDFLPARKRTSRLNVVEIALLPKFSFPTSLGDFSVLMGPALQFMIGNMKTKDSIDDIEVLISNEELEKNYMLSGVFGLGYARPYGSGLLMFDARYRRTFTQPFTDEDYIWKT